MIGLGLVLVALAILASALLKPAPVVLVDARTVVLVRAEMSADAPIRDYGETPMLAPAAACRALSRYRAQTLSGAGTPHLLEAVC